MIPSGWGLRTVSPDGRMETGMTLPRLLLVRQNLPQRSIPDIATEVRKQIARSPLAARLAPGARIAIGVGSRGIHNLAAIVRAAVDTVKERGALPFLFPAMGSHGAATAEGQADVLAHYGITEAAMGCPVVSQLEVAPLGRTAEGIETFMDRAAFEADGVLLVNRVKWHTDFEGAIESGLFKMMAIGIGKFAGAQRYHLHAYNMGLGAMILSVGRQVLASGKVIGGLAILEDGYHNTAAIEAVAAAEMEAREKELLATVKSWMAKIPADLDILVVDEMGKDISGTGMDTKVINRSVFAAYNPWAGLPQIRRVFVRDLSERTYDNAIGLGVADMTTDRLVNRIDWHATAVNALTSTTLASSRTPLHFPTDRECLERLAATVGRFDTAEVTYGWIRNTLEVTRLAMSANLRPVLEANPLIAIEGETEFRFDAAGNLLSPFAAAEEAGAGA